MKASGEVSRWTAFNTFLGLSAGRLFGIGALGAGRRRGGGLGSWEFDLVIGY